MHDSFRELEFICRLHNLSTIPFGDRCSLFHGLGLVFRASHSTIFVSIYEKMFSNTKNTIEPLNQKKRSTSPTVIENRFLILPERSTVNLVLLNTLTL